jgi:hypothetical protein
MFVFKREAVMRLLPIRNTSISLDNPSAWFDAALLFFETSNALIWVGASGIWGHSVRVRGEWFPGLQKGALVRPTRRKLASQIPVPQTRSAFHPHAQRNAFRRSDGAGNVIETHEHKGDFKEP